MGWGIHMERQSKNQWGKFVLFIFVMLVIINSFTLCKVEGKSMQPTLQEEDYVFVNTAVTRFNSLHHGEIVVIKDRDNSKYYVKRVIGLPGETIQIVNGTIYLNDKQQTEQYINRELPNELQIFSEYKRTRIPPNKLFVMGDNRSQSKDSRNGLGYIEEANIIGKVEFVYYPFSKAKLID